MLACGNNWLNSTLKISIYRNNWPSSSGLISPWKNQRNRCQTDRIRHPHPNRAVNNSPQNRASRKKDPGKDYLYSCNSAAETRARQKPQSPTGGLTPRNRSIVTVAALIARNMTGEMPHHIGLALDNGVENRILYFDSSQGYINQSCIIIVGKILLTTTPVITNERGPRVQPIGPILAAKRYQNGDDLLFERSHSSLV